MFTFSLHPFGGNYPQVVDHLGSLGAVAIPRNEYLERLRRAVRAGQP